MSKEAADLGPLVPGFALHFVLAYGAPRAEWHAIPVHVRALEWIEQRAGLMWSLVLVASGFSAGTGCRSG